jgi:hypothetical protein
MTARGWLDRFLEARDGDPELQEDEDGSSPSRAEAGALSVLLGCLAAAAYAPVQAGNRWAMIDIRYHPTAARVRVASWPKEPAFRPVSRQVGHA